MFMVPLWPNPRWSSGWIIFFGKNRICSRDFNFSLGHCRHLGSSSRCGENCREQISNKCYMRIIHFCHRSTHNIWCRYSIALIHIRIHTDYTTVLYKLYCLLFTIKNCIRLKQLETGQREFFLTSWKKFFQSKNCWVFSNISLLAPN